MPLPRLTYVLLTTALTLCLTPVGAGSSSQLTSTTKHQQTGEVNSLVEEFSFLIKDVKVNHQGENNLNICIRYRYKTKMSVSDYPDFRLLAKDIETFLSNYPNETDFWEIVNKKITRLILDKYAAIESVTSQIEVAPTTTVPYLRSSIATEARPVRRGKQ